MEINKTRADIRLWLTWGGMWWKWVTFQTRRILDESSDSCYFIHFFESITNIHDLHSGRCSASIRQKKVVCRPKPPHVEVQFIQCICMRCFMLMLFLSLCLSFDHLFSQTREKHLVEKAAKGLRSSQWCLQFLTPTPSALSVDLLLALCLPPIEYFRLSLMKEVICLTAAGTINRSGTSVHCARVSECVSVTQPHQTSRRGSKTKENHLRALVIKHIKHTSVFCVAGQSC